MKNLISIIAILFVIAGSAAAADYWHFGIGLRGTGVIPGGDYANAVGIGVVAFFGDPDSRFNAQLEVDDWKVVYDFTGLEHQYSGFGFGIYEKYRILNQASRYSPYAVGGFGAYFLELKKEEMTDILGLQLRSQYIHSLFSMSGGAGLEFSLNSRVSAFAEGRYVALFSEFDTDKDLIQSFIGVRYLF